MTRAKSIVDSGGVIGMGARLRGWFRLSRWQRACAAEGCRWAEPAECSLGCGICLVELLLNLFKVSDAHSYQPRNVKTRLILASLFLDQCLTQ